MKILVTGASGFIGRNLVEALAKNVKYRVFGTYNLKFIYLPDVYFYGVDLTFKAQVEELFNNIKPDVVIQCAATTSGANDGKNNPYYHVTDNAVMNSLLLRQAHLCGVKQFIFLSCSVMYNPTTLGKGLVMESYYDGIVPKDYFGVGHTKVYLENVCKFYSQIGSMKCMAIRHSNIYGPHDKFDLKRSHVLGATITKVLNATDTLKVWGTGEETRDFLYVDDLIDFIKLVIDKQEDKFELLNVGSGMPVKIVDLVKEVIRITGKNLRIEHDLDAPTMSSQCPLNTLNAEAKYGWKYKIRLEEGLMRTLDWYEKNKDEIFKESIHPTKGSK